jgi:hypothetical protein
MYLVDCDFKKSLHLFITRKDYEFNEKYSRRSGQIVTSAEIDHNRRLWSGEDKYFGAVLQ